MTAYVIRRLIQTVALLLVMTFVVYFLMGLMPGDPSDIACAANPKCTPETLAIMKHNLGLDRPILVRYWDWFQSFVSGDFGYSRIYRKPVTEILGSRLVNSMILGALSILVSLAIAIPIGVFSSLRPNTKLDYLVNFFAFLGISAPSFWLGLVFMIIFSVWLGWLPAGGVETLSMGDASAWALLLDRLKYLVLPVATLSALTIAEWVRYTRSSMLEVMRMDFIRTARAKGLTSRQVIIGHGLRNALIPVVTIVMLTIPVIASGAVITETIFAYQGAGKLMYDALVGNDYNVAMCSFMITCTLVLLTNLMTDLLYARLDPRITYK